MTRATGRMAGLVGSMMICLWAHEGSASPLKVAALPASGTGVSSALLDVVDETISDKLEAMGHEVIAASGPSAPAGADLVVETHLSKQGDAVQVAVKAIDTASGASRKASATATTGGLLAGISKAVAEVAVEPPAKKAVQPPATNGTAGIEEPEFPQAMHEDMDANPAQMQGGADGLLLIDNVTTAEFRSSTALLASGTILTLAGIGLTIFTVHEWKDFDRWQKWAQENQCLDCVGEAGEKLKVNAALTGVSAAVLLPGPLLLIAGIGKRLKANKMRESASSLVPALALSVPAGGGGGLDLTWTF